MTLRYWLDTLVQDVTFGVRSIRQSPHVALATVITLTLGIGLSAGIRVVLQLGLHVLVEGAHEHAGNAGVGGVVARNFAHVIGVGAFKARVIAAQGLALVAQQFLAEAPRLDAELGLLAVRDGKAGKAGQFGGHGVELRGRQQVSLIQRDGVLAVRKLGPSGRSPSSCRYEEPCCGTKRSPHS
jgi:hypothetical protein